MNHAAEQAIGLQRAITPWPPTQPEIFIGPACFQRFGLQDGSWLLVAASEAGPRPSARIYRSMRETLYRVISTVAHDLRSPLASLFFNVGVLQSRWRELPPEEVDRALDAMSRACELEMKAVAGLVERMDADRGEGTDLSALFERIEELLSPLFRDQDNGLQIDVPAGLYVSAPPMELEQIFVNLIRNAVESQSDPVAVDVVVRGLPDAAQVRIGNDGPPIPPAERASIFKAFFSTKATGTGMGLVFAREAARDLGGNLALLPGPRTVFEVVLPLEKGSPEGSSI